MYILQKINVGNMKAKMISIDEMEIEIPSLREWQFHNQIQHLSDAYDKILRDNNLNPLLYRPKLEFDTDYKNDGNDFRASTKVTVTAVEINPINPINHLPFSDE